MTEILQTDLTRWDVGPYERFLPGPVKIRLTLDGEVIVGCQLSNGYLHRSLEKVLESKKWISGLPYAERVDVETSVFGAWAYCMAVEKLAGIEVSPRVQRIRIVLAELNRISCHLGYLVKLSRAVGAEAMEHYVLRDRETLLDLFELLTGARFTYSFLRFGGVAHDISEGFVDRLDHVCREILPRRLKEYNDLFSFNHSLLQRTGGVAVLSPASVHEFGVTGPNARASGVSFDLRRDEPYGGYELLDFQIPTGKGERGVLGDAHDRLLVRLREITQSIEIIKQAITRVPAGEFSQTTDSVVPAGESYARVESPRGVLGCYVVSDGECPARVQFNPPSLQSTLVLPVITKGHRLEDFPVILSGLDLSIAEVDR